MLYNKKSIVLDDKINSFINWYYLGFVKGKYTKIGEYFLPIKLRELIEKIAVWYEIRYPNYIIFKEFNDQNGNSELNINKSNWNDILNYNSFYNTLTNDEKWLLTKPVYQHLVYLDPDKRFAHLHLDDNGYVQTAEEFSSIIQRGTNSDDVVDEFFRGKHITEVLYFLKTFNISIPNNNELEKTIKNYEEKSKLYNGILDCVMYRIIERGGYRYGPRRGYLFAKEFNKNLSIPIQYGIDTSDPNLVLFIYKYLDDGGNPNITCYENYFSRTSKYDKVQKKELNNYYDQNEYENNNKQKSLIKQRKQAIDK